MIVLEDARERGELVRAAPIIDRGDGRMGTT